MNRREKMQKNHETRNFILLALGVIVVGTLMLLWGQQNSASQVFEIAFQKYKVEDVLLSDENYVFSDEDAELYNKMLASAETWRAGLKAENISLDLHSANDKFGREDAVNIGCELFDQGSETTVVLIHGYNESTADSAVFAPYWWEKGYNVLIPAMRGDGSDTEFTTFGMYEQYDLYDLISEVCPDKRIILHGRGTGAVAALLLAANDDLACGVSLLVCDSPYSDFKALELRQLKAQFGLGNFLTGRLLDRTIKKAFRFDVSDLDIARTAEKLSVPALFVCGAEDKFIGAEDAEKLYNRAASDIKKFLAVPGAANRMAYTKAYFAQGEYCAAIDAFLS
jgi:hypothetical protein